MLDDIKTEISTGTTRLTTTLTALRLEMLEELKDKDDYFARQVAEEVILLTLAKGMQDPTFGDRMTTNRPYYGNL